jgi:hypothetical protein
MPTVDLSSQQVVAQIQHHAFTDGLKRQATQHHSLLILHSVQRLSEQLTSTMQSMQQRLQQRFVPMELWIQSHIASLVRTSFASECFLQSTQLISML